MIIKIRKIGNSSGILLSRSILKQCEIEEDDKLKLSVIDGKIIIEKEEVQHRKGWNELFAQAGVEKETNDFISANLDDTFENEEWTW
jgi:antitoxin MazE